MIGEHHQVYALYRISFGEQGE